MISAYTMTVYVQPDMCACASAILDLLLRWAPHTTRTDHRDAGQPAPGRRGCGLQTAATGVLPKGVQASAETCNLSHSGAASPPSTSLRQRVDEVISTAAVEKAPVSPTPPTATAPTLSI